MKAGQYDARGPEPKDCRPWTRLSGVKFDATQYFEVGRQESQLLEILPCPYVDYVTDDPDVMRKMLSKPFDYLGRLWRPWFVDGRNDDLKAILIPNEVRGGLELAGITTHMASELDVLRVCKYFGTFCGPHKHAAWGEQLDMRQVYGGWIETVRLQHNGAILKGFYRDLSYLSAEARPYADGAVGITPNFLEQVWGLINQRFGYGCKFRSISPIGVGKGFAHLLHGDHPFDYYVYGPKRVVRSRYVYFGNLGELNPGAHVRTDIQMVINFLSHRPSLIVDLARDFMHKVIAAFRDDDTMVELLASNLPLMNSFWDDIDGERTWDPNAWPLAKALLMDMGYQWAPGLARKVFGVLMDKVMKCSELRIPLDGHAVAADISSPLDMLTDDAMVDLEQATLIPAGYCCCMDAPEGKIIALRSPNGSPNEACVLINKHLRRFRKYKGMRRLFVGKSMATLLKACGGADLDDRFVVVYDPEMVAAIEERIGSYPVVEPIVPAASQPIVTTEFTDDANPGFTKQVFQYGAHYFHNIVRYAEDSNLGIGRIVNPLMLDVAISGDVNRNCMIRDLKEQIAAAEDQVKKDFLQSKLDKLEAFPHYSLAKIGNSLETLIDAIKKNGESTRQYAVQLNRFMGFDKENAGVPVFPRFWHDFPVTPGKPGKMPASLKDKGDYAIARTPICMALEEIAQLRQKLEFEFERMQWRMVRPLPEALVSPIVDDTVYEEVSKLRQWWYQKWNGRHEVAADSKAAYKNIVSGVFDPKTKELVEEGVEQMWRRWAKPIREEMALELAARVYNDIYVDGSGRYPDGLLWTRPIANDFLDAVDGAGLAGLRIPVDTKGVRFQGDTIVDVLPMGTWNCVFRRDDHYLMGEVPGWVEPGEYTMSGNLMLIRSSDRYFRSGLAEKEHELAQMTA